MRRLVKGGTVVTMNAKREIYRQGYVLIEGERIADVGPRDRTPPADSADEVIDADGKIVVPGLINAHQHHWYTLCKGLGGGMLLEEWIHNLLVPAGSNLTDDDMAVSTALSCLEMLRSGTTCALYHMTTSTTASTIERIAETVLQLGMRHIIAKEVRPDNLQKQLSLAEALIDDWHGVGNGLVRMGLTVETTSHWVLMGACSDELVIKAHELAQAHGLIITDHIAGGTLSRDEGYLKYIRETGRTDIMYLQQLGVLDEHWLLIHSIWLQDGDIAIIADSGASVVNCPTSHGMRAGGVTPVFPLIQAGVNVALGSDGPMVDNTVDMIEQMKATCIEQNQRHLNPNAVTPEMALEMATVNAAKALSLDNHIGSLEEGKFADIAIFDLQLPHVGVVHNPIASLVTTARGTDAWMVMVNGQVLLWEGQFTTVEDPYEILFDARERAEALIERASLGTLRQQRWPVVGPSAG